MTKEKAIDILDDDMISGESVKDIRRALLFYGDHFMSCNQINRFFNRFLKIEKPKTGYWREVDVNEYACSNCNHCFSIVSEDNSIEEFKYCPNCKTKMVGHSGQVEPQERSRDGIN